VLWWLDFELTSYTMTRELSVSFVRFFVRPSAMIHTS
jgi:hypothetical protein